MYKYRKYLKIVLIFIGLFIISITSFKAGNYYMENKNQNLIEQQKPKSTFFKRSPLVIRAAIPYWDQENAYSSFEENVNKINYISLFWYYIDDKGNVIKYKDANEDKDIIDFAHANNVKAIAVITNLPETEGSDWDAQRVEIILQNKLLRKKHIENILAKVNAFEFDGVSIDYEQITDIKQKENFTLFIKELSEELHRNKKITEVALHPKTAELKSSEDNGSTSQDWKQLSRYADHLYIMAYGEHWDSGNPGPIASISWVEKIIKYSQNLKIDPNKLYLGIPLYGYEWKTSSDDEDNSAKGLTFKDVKKIKAEYDIEDIEWSDKAKSPYFYYENDNSSYEVWYENSKSVYEKVLLAYNANLKGITFWRLGGEDPDIWSEIENM